LPKKADGGGALSAESFERRVLSFIFFVSPILGLLSARSKRLEDVLWEAPSTVAMKGLMGQEFIG
jgi:hypothetical protein